MDAQAQIMIHQLEVGRHENFSYVLADPASNRAVVVDPSWDVAKILAVLGKEGYVLEAIWLTHGHQDHTNGIEELTAAHPAPIFISRQMPDKWRPRFPDVREFDDGDQLYVGNLAFTALHTPGHSPDGTCFLHRNHLIAGDTLFIDGCGRCDLPDSDVDAMYESLHHRIMALPDNTIIYPGHDYGTLTFDSLANQKKSNRFLAAPDKESFIAERMG